MSKIELPLGFGIALAQNESAMARFEALSEGEKRAVIQKTHRVKSRDEMRALVDSISNGELSL